MEGRLRHAPSEKRCWWAVGGQLVGRTLGDGQALTATSWGLTSIIVAHCWRCGTQMGTLSPLGISNSSTPKGGEPNGHPQAPGEQTISPNEDSKHSFRIKGRIVYSLAVWAEGLDGHQACINPAWAKCLRVGTSALPFYVLLSHPTVPSRMKHLCGSSPCSSKLCLTARLKLNSISQLQCTTYKQQDIVDL